MFLFMKETQNIIEKNPGCFIPGEDNAYSSCIGLGKPECEVCQFRADREPEELY